MCAEVFEGREREGERDKRDRERGGTEIGERDREREEGQRGEIDKERGERWRERHGRAIEKEERGGGREMEGEGEKEGERGNLNLNLFLFYNGHKLSRMPLFI